MPINQLKPKTGVVAIAATTIAQQETAAEIRACQDRYQARMLDLENEVAARRNKMRAEYLAQMAQISNGEGDDE